MILRVEKLLLLTYFVADIVINPNTSTGISNATTTTITISNASTTTTTISNATTNIYNLNRCRLNKPIC